MVRESEVQHAERIINDRLETGDQVSLNHEDFEFFAKASSAAAEGYHRGNLPTTPPKGLAKSYKERMEHHNPADEHQEYLARSMFGSLGLAVGSKSQSMGGVGEQLSYWSSSIPCYLAMYDDSSALKVWNVYGADTLECLDVFEVSKDTGKEMEGQLYCSSK